ncbi:MAG: SPFH/Band 7/PHB domain protein [Drouetiella hepatica Uher 2000/2452]|jgi:regulator of protease activity HflC (stomatin/prohibitin superfamily)|uniref:SPFH/Band 7/PHB domain protein n=1 Tax=Drouetiella hepatica Uher 2000/2452 TaxID=904376 RepID=A0A951URI9_9CYAN|nr:SPFH/Band 7/PHB domain protein [Drouetiella hepatica Uher 2000/2452]
MESLVWGFVFVLTILGGTVGSTRRITEGNEALVERLGRYHRKLTPGLNFGIIPFVDEVVTEASTREQMLDTPASGATTRDNVRVDVDAIVFWRILELQQAYYEIQDIEEALKNLVITTLRAEVGEMDLEDTNSARTRITRALLESLDEATEPWGVKVIRVEIQDIKPPKSVQDSLEKERAAESERRAVVLRAEGERKASIEQASAIADSLKLIKEALPEGANSAEILRYLVAQRYVEANFELSKSDNAKVVFMNPRDLTESMSELISDAGRDSSKGRDSGSSNRPSDN